MTDVGNALLLVAHVNSRSNDWGNPVVWIALAVFFGALLLVGFLLIRRPFRRSGDRSSADPERSPEDLHTPDKRDVEP
jgi:hypothetical protein